MTRFKSEACFVIGGRDLGNITLRSVSHYSIVQDKWEAIGPTLNLARSGATACSFGNSLLVFAGINSKGKHFNSVERINVPVV